MPRIFIVHYEEDPEAIVNFRIECICKWGDHINYTRDAIISIIAGLDDINVVADRLLTNQVEIGNLIEPYYGKESAGILTDLLKLHIGIGADIVRYIKAGRTYSELRMKWDANAADIANCLFSLDPDNWSTETTLSHFKNHMDLTLAEATARYAMDWMGDIAAYDAVNKLMYKMAEYFSAGIISKFPEKFVKYDQYVAKPKR